MKCKRIRITNIGPVADGEIVLKKVTVFFGPNNTGKSIVSRIIHALQRLDPPSSMLRQLGRNGGKKIDNGGLLRLYGEAILLHSSLARDNIITHGQKSCSLTVSRGPSMPDLDLSFEPPGEAYSAQVDMLHNPTHTGKAQRNSVYIPAGRTGTVQSFTDIINLKMSFMEFALQSVIQHAKRALAEPPTPHPPKREDVMPPSGSLPPTSSSSTILSLKQ